MNVKQSKVSKATQAAIRGGNFYDDGVIDGQDMGVTYQSVIANLARCKTPADRTAYRGGFMAGYMGVTKCSEEAARRQFYRLAKKHAPASSNKQHKANAKKEAAAKATDAKVEKIAKVMSEKDMARALLGASVFIAHWQSETKDADVTDRLGKLLAIITPKSTGKVKADVDAEGDDE